MNPATHMLSLEEVADELDVGLTSVKAWVKDKLLASFIIGGVRKVSELSLTEFVLAHTVRQQRPKWLTPEIQAAFEKKLDEIVERKFRELAGGKWPALAA